MTHDDIGTLRWFGASWGAPMNDPRAQIPTPIGDRCARCNEIFIEEARGVSIPYHDRESFATRIAYHLSCFLDEFAGPHIA